MAGRTSATSPAPSPNHRLAIRLPQRDGPGRSPLGKKLRGLAPLLVIVIGLLVLFYPTISNFLVMKNASRVVSNYDAAVEALSDEEYRSMIDAAHAYNTRLAEGSSGTTSALTGAVNTEATDAEYMKLLNLAGDGMMGYITVPKLKETLPIYHGTSEKVLQSGIGHLEQTSLCGAVWPPRVAHGKTVHGLEPYEKRRQVLYHNT